MPDRRIIAIAMLPKAYDEILRLKGQDTWTGFILDLVIMTHPDNKVIMDEIASLPKKAEPKPKVEKKLKAEKKPKAEEKATKVKKVKVADVATKVVGEQLVVEAPGEEEPGEAELKAIEESLPQETTEE